MTRVFPFQAYRYTEKAGDPSALATQPYDKIPPELQERYLTASPYNFVRLIKGKAQPDDNASNNVYARAARTLDDWISEGILAQDPEPCFYPYFQEFNHPETGQRCIRKGFIGTLQLAEYEERVVHPHELTHKGPKRDRLELTRSTKAYFGQLFVLYDDVAHEIDRMLDGVARSEPLMKVEEQGVTHKLWKISDPNVVDRIQTAMESKKILMADGHHRYETALAYSRENPDVPGADRCMMTFVNMSSEGVVVLATHRVLFGLDDLNPAALLERLAPWFEIERADSDEALQTKLDASAPDEIVIGAAFAGEQGGRLLRPKKDIEIPALEGLPELQRKLDVAVLHRAILGEAMGITEEDVRDLKNIRYVRGAANAIADVRSGAAQVAFLLRPIPAHRVAEISFAGGVMPQKSTDFYPKLLSGLTTYRFG